jgi:hypothetical protein
LPMWSHFPEVLQCHNQTLKQYVHKGNAIPLAAPGPLCRQARACRAWWQGRLIWWW